MQLAATKPASGGYSEKFDIRDLCEFLAGRIPKKEINVVYQAWEIANQAHEGQTRRSGEPYIFHPLAVAKTVAEMNMDYRSISAAILHDVLEDTPLEREELAAQMDEEISVLVDGLSKLTHLKFESQVEAQAANFRKMLLAVVDDIRVVLIKLADRLHNMQTLGSMPSHKQRRIARETLDIYAPIANRLGIKQIKNELEDLGFMALYPARYRVLKEAVERARGNRVELVQKIEQQFTSKLEEIGIEAHVNGREKHLYSLYEKMRAKQLSFQEVFDMFAVRVVVNSVDDCYRTLGQLHSLYKPIPGHFKDYIAIPKANGYQSLHNVLFTEHGTPVEVQIRSSEMDQFAESGIAAHWIYKTGEGTGVQTRARKWLSTLIDMGQKAGDSQEFLDSVKADLFPDEIYVFSPKGDIYELPRESTAIDFAYAIHSDVGNTCVTVKIDRRLASLSTTLHSGQTVEIVTAPGARPSPMWLNFVVTAKARTAIRSYLKNLKNEEARDFGRRLIDRALSRHSASLDSIDTSKLDSLIKEFGFSDIDEFFVDIGLGNRIPSAIANRLMGQDNPEEEIIEEPPEEPLGPLMIDGGDATVVTLARCCMPIPGDNIQGFLTSGSGVVVHRAGCRNVGRYRRRPKEWVPVEWAEDYSGEFQANTVIELRNRPGSLARIANTLDQMNTNIENMRFETTGESFTRIIFTLSVRDRKHMARIIRRLRNLTVVDRIKRETPQH
ncbi:MAG: bifunctional (p)ppGpp synthetase/guanosine-3',5'-bis(diphosphate) 3'-pyrophosphohydrolase [Pseudomonadota bacterium]